MVRVRHKQSATQYQGGVSRTAGPGCLPQNSVVEGLPSLGSSVGRRATRACRGADGPHSAKRTWPVRTSLEEISGTGTREGERIRRPGEGPA